MQSGINSPIRFYKAGSCKHPNAIVMKTEKWKANNFPLIVTLIKHHTAGYMLFDAGYSEHFFKATTLFPERIYRWITPVSFNENDRIDKQLHKDGIKPLDIKYIIISHFHADHISGLNLFPSAQFICSEEAYNAMKNSMRIRGLIKGYLPKLLPADFHERVQFVETFPTINLSNLQPFNFGWQLFDDSSCIVIPLPGHAVGHIGLFYSNQTSAYFLVGDACWQIQSCKQKLFPHWLAYLIKADKNVYNETLEKLNMFHYSHPEVKIVPSHCAASYRELCDEFSI